MKNKKSYIMYFIFDIFFIMIAFLYMIYLKPASLRIYLPLYIKPFLGFAVVWLFSSFIGDKYNLGKFDKFINMFSSIIRVNFVVVGIVLIAMYAFGRFGYSRIIVFGTILFSSLLEFIFVFVYFIRKKYKDGFDEYNTYFIKPSYIYPYFSHDESDFPNPKMLEEVNDSIEYELKTKYLKTQNDLFDLLKSQVPLISISKKDSLVLNTRNLYNFKTIDQESLSFLMNLHRVNDFFKLNQYFIQVNKSMKFGGYFVGCVESINVRRHYFFNKYSYPIAVIMNIIDLFLNRVIPKLPLLKVLYCALTNGRNRALSKAETLGRLQYYGFKVIAVKELYDQLYFITIKMGKPSKNANPSYGPLIKMQRVGKNGKMIYIYKFRTMHAYSEYLQKYIHEQNNLEDGGKFVDDFRITGWGKVLRKLWIDELPQLINWIQGDVSLVGVRPLSSHYFSLYPKDIQKLRVQFKPGLIPPYYADMPKNFDEIIESEKRYLLKRKKHPINTQIEYFFKVFWNIFFKGERSK